MICEKCKHYDSMANGVGVCKRYPPTVSASLIPKRDLAGQVKLETVELVSWPRVEKNNRCGEYSE